jgi:excisionase family DNA binding protein
MITHMGDVPDVLSVSQAARLERCTISAIYKAIFRERVPAFKLRGRWLIRREDLERWRKTDEIAACKQT